jgi:hypothetical protein
MRSKVSAGRRFAYGLAALAVVGMALSTPAEAQNWRGHARAHVMPGAAAHWKPGANLRYGSYVAGPHYHAFPVRARWYRGYAYGHPGYYAYPGYTYAYPGYGYPAYAYGYPGYYGYPYGFYRKKRSNRAAIAAAVIGGMALGAILSSQARHPRKAYYYKRRHY